MRRYWFWICAATTEPRFTQRQMADEVYRQARRQALRLGHKVQRIQQASLSDCGRTPCGRNSRDLPVGEPRQRSRSVCEAGRADPGASGQGYRLRRGDSGTKCAGFGEYPYCGQQHKGLFPDAHQLPFYLPNSGLRLIFGIELCLTENGENLDGTGYPPDLWVPRRPGKNPGGGSDRVL